MSAAKLNFETHIQAMKLTNQEDQTFIRECLLKYARPTTFYETVLWLAYRLVNAVKSIFGWSDWQIAEKKLENQLLLKIDRIHQEKPQNNIEKNIKEDIILHGVKSLASQFLTFCLSAKEGNPIAEKQLTILKMLLHS